jgi:DNA polymerase-4
VRARVILHVDMDAFFASVEQRCNPFLKGKPVIVCGDPNGRSVVASASYEARPCGVRSAMPVSTARRLCPEAVFVEGNPAKYVSISIDILETLKAFSPVVEPFSIDEAFVDLSGCVTGWNDAVATAVHMKGRIRSRTALSASIGVSYNKSVAKVASDLQKPDGLTLIRPQDVPSVYYPLPVERLWGVGPRTKEALSRAGVRTIGHLAKVPARTLVEMFGVTGKALSLLAQGKDGSPVISHYQGVEDKSMGHEYTFPYDVSDLLLVERTLLQLCDQVGRRLRKGGVTASRFTVRVRYPDFQTVTRARSVSFFTNDDNVIYDVARSLIVPLVAGRSVRMIGVSSSRFSKCSLRIPSVETHLFEDGRSRLPVLRTADRIRDRFGEDALVRARLFTDRPLLHS